MRSCIYTIEKNNRTAHYKTLFGILRNYTYVCKEFKNRVMRLTFYIFIVLQSMALVGSVVGLLDLGRLVLVPLSLYILHFPIVYLVVLYRMRKFNIEIQTKL